MALGREPELISRARKAALAMIADQVSLAESAGLDEVARELLAIVMREARRDLEAEERAAGAALAQEIMESGRRFWGSLTPEEQAAMNDAWSETVELPGPPADGREP